MSEPVPSTEPHDLIVTIDRLILEACAERQTATHEIIALNAEQSRNGHHPNYPAYIMGGMLTEHGFGAGHIAAVLGIHALDWRAVLERMAATPPVHKANEADLLPRLRNACETDPMLEVTGERLAAELGLLDHDRLDPFWLKRPKFGLGQAALAFGIEPEHANGHRGLYALPVDVLKRGFERVGAGQSDQRFGAMLVPLIETGGERLARIGADAFHHDAEARYQHDCARFAAHQRKNPDRRWRWKPPMSRQGHLAVTTAHTLGVDMPAERTRGHAANWLADHDANLRFMKSEA